MRRFVLSTAAILAAMATSAVSHAQQSTIAEGKSIFQLDTFGSEQLWTDTLRMQDVIKDLSPRTALSVGLKVDADALPPAVVDAIKAGQVNLDDPAVTIQLLKLDAVIGVVGKVVGANDNLKSIGITCALCHSTVDNSVAPGIGRRLDGWANRTLNVGAIIALSPAVSDKSLFQSWGPGRFDPRLQIFNGTSIVRINASTVPVLIPSIFGLAGVNFETFTGDGPISYWNNYVGVSQMGGQGSFSDPRIGITITQTPDLVTPKLPALLAYQLSLATPPPPPGSFQEAAARRGRELFNGAARCSTCHTPPLLTDVNNGPNRETPLLHSPFEIGTDPRYAQRSATKMYRTTPLRALWQHPPYFHDGSAASLLAVVNHYNRVLGLGLKDRQKADLVEFLKTL
jgi:hypothetical protein